MGIKVFLIFFSLMYLALLKTPVAGDWAYFNYYLPLGVLVLWLLQRYIKMIFDDENERDPSFPIAQGVLRFFDAVFVGLAIYVSFIALAPPFFSPSHSFTKGQIRRLENHGDFLSKRYSYTMIEVLHPSGEARWYSVDPTQGLDHWVGQDVLTRTYGFHFLFADPMKFDNLTWNQRILKKWPNSKSAWKALIIEKRQNQDRVETFNWVQAYVKNFGYDHFVEEVANELWSHQELDQVLKIYELAYSVNSKDFTVLKQLGFYLAKKGDLQRSTQFLNAAIQLKPEDFAGYYQLGLVLYEAGQAQMALPYLRKTFELNPGLVDVKNLLQQIDRDPASQL